MANEVIGIEVQVKLEQLRAQLATLGPGMEKEAKAMTAALAKEIKQQTAAMKAASKATSQVRSESVKAAGDAAENAGTKFDKLAKAAGPLGGVLSRVSPEAGAAASSIAGLASAAEGIAGAGLVASTGAAAAGLAVLAAVVGTVYVAYKIYNADAERAAMIAEQVRSATEKLTPIFDEHEAAVRRLKVATGELSAEQLANLQIGDAAAKRLQDAIGDTSKKVGQLRVEQASMWTQAVDGIESYAPAWTPLGAAVRAFTVNSAELGTEIEALQGVVTKAIDVTKDQTETDREAAKITDKKTAATKAYSAALAEAAATASVYDKDEFARLLAAKEEKDAAVRQRVKAVQKGLDDEKAAKDKAAKEDIRRAEETAQAEIEARGAVKSASLSIMGSATDALMLLSDNLGESNKKAALDAFNAAKALAIATAVVNAALGVTNALATGGAAAPVLAVAAGVSGAVSIATIAATEPPAFAAGGFIDGAPTTGVPITAHPNEAVLNQQGRAALGDDAIRAANAGRGGEGGMTVSMVYKHKVFDYFVRDNLRTGGPLASAVRRGDRVGQLRRGRG